MIILGIGFGHDAAASLLVDGAIVANVAEERFTRVKHDSGFPTASVQYCLSEAGLSSKQIDFVAVAGQFLPSGMERHFILTQEQSNSLAAARPRESRVRQLLINSGMRDLPLYSRKLEVAPHCKFISVDHHLAHASSAYFTRGRSDPCLVFTLDGVGDEVSAAVWMGEKTSLRPLASWDRNASLGWFYGNVTEALGWQHGDGEGTVMGLAPYGIGATLGDRLDGFHPVFRDGLLLTAHDFGHASYYNQNGTYHWHFADADAIHALTLQYSNEDIAARAQEILEEQVLGLVRHWTGAYNTKRIACSGGIFLNVKLNQRIWNEMELEEHWVFPDPGDSGIPLGAALHLWHTRTQTAASEKLEHLYYGPRFHDAEIRKILETRRLSYREVKQPALTAAELLASGKIVGWFQGRMEAGPRALGNRSILMSPTTAANKDAINSRVKFRESFRPFCPSILFERKDDYLLNGREENFMVTSFDVKPEKRNKIPAVVHADGTLRPQTVKRNTNPLFHELIEHFGKMTGEYALLNTSFNIKGEPIVCNPREAIRCFFDTGIDALVMGTFVLEKS